MSPSIFTMAFAAAFGQKCLTATQDESDLAGRHATVRPSDRLGGTAAAVAACIRGGAEILRVHDVRAMREATLVATALYRPDLSTPP